MKRCVIFGGGDILDYGACGRELRGSDTVLCADSGYRHCERLGIVPALLVGDFDSIGRVPEGIEVLHYPAEKNFTDTALAADWALERGYPEILFMGMTGGSRLDHTLANLQTAAACAKCGVSCRMTDGVTDIHFFYTNKKPLRAVIAARGDCYFSLISFSERCRDVTIRGGKYPLEHYDLRFDEARAVSNEFTGVPAEITYSDGLLLVLVTAMG